ncbi:MAG: hypothetical protein KDB01_03790, partial [Planctomycetaceae bacterium]|nr:hypothetical protein [Planctomycetaceae bacterium]
MTSADDENDDIVDPSPEPLDDASQVEWIVGPGTNLPPHPIATIVDNREIYRQQRAAYQAHKRRQFRISVMLFVLTLCSTFLVASGYVPFRWLAAKYVPEYQQQLERVILEQALEKGEPPGTVDDLLWEGVIAGLMYSIPLMSILFCHEMGHYLQSVRNRVPASFPYFIPLPLPPLGTMGAV